MRLDLLTAEFPGWSPYHYVLGNPISWVDPDGREPLGTGDEKYKVYSHSKFGY